MPKGTFDAQQYLADNGLTLEGVVDNGIYKVRNSDGKAGTLNLSQMMKDQGYDPSKISYNANSPDKPIEISPLGLMDRGKLAFGNAEGKISYLKNKFEAVQYNPDKGLVVKDKGAWHAVDPAGLGSGDAWDMTKELAKDFLDLGDVVVSGSISTVGAIYGNIAGAGAGGAVGGAINTSLGRLAGTYSATPEEQIKDIGWEALLNMGGQAVALGAKPGLGMLKSALKNLGEKASIPVKSAIAEGLGSVTGTGAKSMRMAMDSSDDIIKELSKAKVGVSAGTEIVDNLTRDQIKTAESILEQAPKKLSYEYGAKKAALLDAAKDMGQVDVGSLAKGALDSLEKSGILKSVGEGEKRVFQVMDDVTAIKYKNAGKAAEILDPEVEAQLKPILNKLNAFSKLEKFNGPKAAETLMDLQKNINSIVRDAIGPSTAPTTERTLLQVKDSFNGGIKDLFNAHGLGEAYSKTGEVYTRYADSVSMARRMASSVKGPQELVSKIVSDTQANFTSKELTKDLAELLGTPGQEMLKKINVQEAAKNFSPWLSKSGLVKTMVIPSSTYAGGPAAAAGTAAMTSPRVILNSIDMGKRSLKFLQGLNPMQQKQFLIDDKAMETFFRTSLTGGALMDANTNNLVKQTTGQK